MIDLLEQLGYSKRASFRSQNSKRSIGSFEQDANGFPRFGSSAKQRYRFHYTIGSVCFVIASTDWPENHLDF